MTIRRRLLLGIVLSLALLVAAVGVAEVIALRTFLYNRTAERLRDELRLISVDSSSPDGNGTVAPSGGCPAQFPAPPGGGGRSSGPSPNAEALARALASRGIASAVVAGDGTVLACADSGRTGVPGTFTVPPGAFATPSQGPPPANGYQTFDNQGRHLLGITQRLGRDPDSPEVILVTDLSDDDAALRTVVLVTLVGGGVALVVALGLSWPLLRGGLAPLRTVAVAADAIAAGDFSQRARLTRTRDEIGTLGSAFDRMVDRLQASIQEQERLVVELRRNEAMMRRFVADASHELRTPLTAIRGSAQVLQRGSADDPVDLAEGLGHIRTEAERMARLVEDLLTLSRSDAAEQPVHVALDLGMLVEGDRDRLTVLAGGHDLEIDVAPAPVVGDRDALLRVCNNLVENAAKYSPLASRVDVSVGERDGQIELAVRDHGPGIVASDRERIFERFYRGDPARSRRTGGSGLGLAIVRSVVADHGGTVSVDPTISDGARLLVRLPRGPRAQ